MSVPLPTSTSAPMIPKENIIIMAVVCTVFGIVMVPLLVLYVWTYVRPDSPWVLMFCYHGPRLTTMCYSSLDEEFPMPDLNAA